MGIIFNFFQISALFGSFSLNWPDELMVVFNVFSSINLNIDLFSPDCAGTSPNTPFHLFLYSFIYLLSTLVIHLVFASYFACIHYNHLGINYIGANIHQFYYSL